MISMFAMFPLSVFITSLEHLNMRGNLSWFVSIFPWIGPKISEISFFHSLPHHDFFQWNKLIKDSYNYNFTTWQTGLKNVFDTSSMLANWNFWMMSPLGLFKPLFNTGSILGQWKLLPYVYVYKLENVQLNRFTPSGCKYIGVRKFVTKTKFNWMPAISINCKSFGLEK